MKYVYRATITTERENEQGDTIKGSPHDHESDTFEGLERSVKSHLLAMSLPSYPTKYASARVCGVCRYMVDDAGGMRLDESWRS